ncbi:MAG: 2-oxoglutarate dehydrogenase E1 subunit family protein, partial [Pirellulaceae bacterium]
MNTYSLDYIDDLYVRYVQDPSSVSTQWRKYFEQFSLASQREQARAESGDLHPNAGAVAVAENAADSLWLARMQERVDLLVREYRVRGHLMARLDPLGLDRLGPPELDPVSHGLSEADLRRPFTDPTSE